MSEIQYDNIRDLARTSIDKFENIAGLAKKYIESRMQINAANAFIDRTSAEYGSSNLNDIVRMEIEKCQKISQEPLIAKIRYELYINGDKQVCELYVCRYSPPTGTDGVASYRSGLGRLASLRIGEIYDMTEETGVEKYDDAEVCVIEKSVYRVIHTRDSFDSINTEYSTTSSKTIKIPSLRKLLHTDETKKADLGNRQAKCLNINDIRASLIRNFSLRDQPILDEIQDSIFRMPINTAMMLTGPAGSGKTTTLIRRLGQKLDDNVLSKSEKKDIDCVAHMQKWIMFTPTDLLKSYLKEAFNKENIAAPDDNISTYLDFAKKIARDTLKFLRSPSDTNLFQLDSNVINTLENCDTINMYDDFYKFQIHTYIETLNSKITNFINGSNYDKTVDELYSIMDGYPDINFDIVKLFEFLVKNKAYVIAAYKNKREELDVLIRKTLKNHDDQAIFLSKLFTHVTNSDDDKDYTINIADEGDALDENLSLESTNGSSLYGSSDTESGFDMYKKFIIWYSLYEEPQSISNRRKQILNFLSNIKALPEKNELISIRKAVTCVDLFRQLNNPLSNFFKSIANNYKKFRKQRQDEGIWYNADAALSTNRINQTEFDILILSHFHLAYKILSRSYFVGLLDDAWLTYLKKIHNIYRHQVLVDESPDFSPLQLQTMDLIANPRTNSFFMCGDFHQRLQEHGTINIDQYNRIRKIVGKSGIDVKKIQCLYRQRNVLQNLSSAILDPNVHCDTGSESTYEFFPVLSEGLNSEMLARWLNDRIIEIYKICDTLPSIAILVPEENYIDTVHASLKKLLDENNIPVQALHEGQTKGHAGAVRIFSIKHIKGLEFEAAFFVCLDKICYIYPQLIKNYLYVGATRAVTFLGVTCEESLPQDIAYLREFFVDNWNIPTSASALVST